MSRTWPRPRGDGGILSVWADPQARPLFGVLAITSAASGMYTTFGTLFFIRSVGLNDRSAGIGLTVAGILGMAGLIHIGRISDRLGARETYIALLLAQALARIAFVFVHSFVAFVMVAAISAFGDRGSAAAGGALIGALGDQRRRVKLQAYLRSATNAGFAVGTLAAAPVVEANSVSLYAAVMIANAIGLAAAAVLLLKIARIRPGRGHERTERSRTVLRDRRYLIMVCVNAVMTFHYDIVAFALPLWITQYVQAPRWMVSAVFICNTATIILLQPRASRNAERVNVAVRRTVWAAFTFLASCTLFGLAGFHSGRWIAAGLLLVGILVHSIGELWQAGAAFGLSYALADENSHGEYQAAFALGRGVARAVAPSLLAILCLGHGFSGWIAAGVIIMGAGLLMGPAIRIAGNGESLMSAVNEGNVEEAAGRLYAAAEEGMRNDNPYHHYINYRLIADAAAPLTSWPAECSLRWGMISLEITAALACATASDKRAEAAPEVRIDRLLESIAEQVRLLALLAGSEPGLPRQLVTPEPVLPPSHIAQLAALAGEHRSRLAAIITVLHEEFRGRPVGIGLESVANGIRAAMGYPSADLPGQALDYALLARPELVAELNRVPRYGAEDHLFASTHQVVECWLAVVIDLLERAIREEQERSWPHATRLIRIAGAVFRFLANHLSLFDEMVLADYHELRVRLKGSSGAQSRAAHRSAALVKRLFDPIQAELALRDISLYVVYRVPSVHVDLYQAAEAVAVLDSASAAFYFQHYAQALRVQGSRGIGALGQGTLGLTARFLQPVRPEIDEARCDHVIVSNLEHADVQGTLVMRGESDLPRFAAAAAGVSAATAPPLAKGRVADLFDALAAMDIARCVELFAPDGFVQDPEGSRPYRGRRELSSYFEGLLQALTSPRFQIRDAIGDGTEMLISWDLETDLYGGNHGFATGSFRISTDDRGRLLSLIGIWQPATLLHKIESALCASPQVGIEER